MLYKTFYETDKRLADHKMNEDKHSTTEITPTF